MRLINPNRLNKNVLYIALGSIGFTAFLSSNAAHSEIYKWRDNRGVIQYSDNPPASGFTKANRHEIVNALQSKDLCAEPSAKTAATASAKKIEANFFGFNTPVGNRSGNGNGNASGMGFMGQPARAVTNNGFSGFNNFGRPASNPVRNSSASKPAPSRPAFGAAGIFGVPQRNNAPSFGGLNPSGGFNNGNGFVTIFGKPVQTAATKPVSGIPGLTPTVTPKPTPAPTPTPTATPTPVNPPNVIQSGLMPAVDVSKNMTQEVGASEKFIGAYEPPGPGDGDGQFRTSCKPSHMSNDDPIIYPNQKGAAHHHTFFGNVSVDYKSDVSNLRNVGNTTCQGGIANRSAYWVPSMIDSSTKKPLVPGVAIIYYKTGYMVKKEDITLMPKGLRMIAGNGRATATQRENQYTNHVTYKCNIPNNNTTKDSDSIPACPRGAQLATRIHFPNCWDGKNLDSPDHKSHMSYPIGYQKGCPAKHPIGIPNITFNIFYNVTEAAGTANWRLASDNYAKSGYNAGYSGHGDWVNGWDESVMLTAIANCHRKGVDCGVGNLGNGTGLWVKKDSRY